MNQEMTVTDTQEKLQILQHALGQDQFGRGGGFRNHFVTDPGCRDFKVCTALAAEGLMQQRPGSPITGGNDWFCVTDAGKEYVRENSPAPPKLTRSQRRYREFLRADSSKSFGEWLADSSRQKRPRERQVGG